MIANDVDAGVFGEYSFGAGRGARCVVGVFPGTGIGGGIVAHGKVNLGVGGAGGELGHMIVKAGGPRCGCGAKGCMEALASKTAIQRRITS